MQKAKVVVDLSNGSATIRHRHGGTWSGVTRRGTEGAIRSAGWSFAPGSYWTTTSPPDGEQRDVIREG